MAGSPQRVYDPMCSLSSSRKRIVCSHGGTYGEPSIAVSTDRFPPTRRPRALPGVIVVILSRVCARLSPVERGLRNVSAAPSMRTRLKCPTENWFQVDVPTGPWNVIRPAFAKHATSSDVISL